MNTNHKTGEVLRDLIRTNNDRIEGYGRAIKELKGEDSKLSDHFNSMADESRKYVSELEQYARTLGVELPKDNANSAAGKVYHVWMDIKASAASDRHQAVLNACEYGEDAAQHNYKAALETKELDSEIRTVISQQQAQLKNSHDWIKQQRDASKNRKEEEHHHLH